jgi:hypothetical protein
MLFTLGKLEEPPNDYFILKPYLFCRPWSRSIAQAFLPQSTATQITPGARLLNGSSARQGPSPMVVAPDNPLQRLLSFPFAALGKPVWQP